MVDVAGLAHDPVVDGLRAVAVGVEQERAVVVVAVLRPRARLAVAREAGPGARPPKLVHFGTRGRDETDVQAPGRRLAFRDRSDGEVVSFGDGQVRVGLLDPERREHEVVEALRRLTVRHADGDVIEHRLV